MQNASSVPSTVPTSTSQNVHLVISTSSGSTLVTLTSFMTETIRPTLTYTDVTTISNDPVTTHLVSSQLITTTTHQEISQVSTTKSQSDFPGTPGPESTQSETQHETTQQTPSPTPIASSDLSWTTSHTPEPSSSESPSSILSQLYMPPQTSMSELNPIPFASSPSTTSLGLSTSFSAGASMITPASSQFSEPRGAPGLQIVTTSQDSTEVSSSSAIFTPSQSPTSTGAAVVSGSARSSQNTSDSATTMSSHKKTGIIVGSVVGGAAFIFLVLLAFFLFRRRRRSHLHRRQHSRQQLLRSDSENSAQAFLHNRQPSWPIIHSAIPSAPVFPPQRSYSNPDTRPNPALGASNQAPSLDRVYQRSDYPQRFADNPYQDHNDGPLIEVSPPSRSASIYSRSSWEGGLKFLELYDSSSLSSHEGSTYHPGGSTVTLAGPGNDTPSSSKYLTTPKRRASIRSNPFDLEAPPSAASRGPVPRLPKGSPNPAWGRWH